MHPPILDSSVGKDVDGGLQAADCRNCRVGTGIFAAESLQERMQA